MCKKFVLLCMVLGLFLTPTVQAANIVWVAGAHDDNDDGAADDQGWVDFLTGLGHTVDFQRGYWTSLDDAKIATLNEADLVIVSRCSGSGDYDDAPEPTQWNEVTTPLILQNVYIARSSRWLWIDGTSLKADAGTPTIEAVDVHHPIFNNVTADAQGRLDIWDQSVGSGTVSMYSGIDLGNGTLIAKELDQDVTVIAEWEPGLEFYAGTGQTPAAKRMLFCAGTREGNGQGRGEFNLNDEGKTLFTNMVNYMLGDLVREPWVKAWQPDPADGAVGVVLPLFQWTGGDTAVLHDVYMGTSPELTEGDLVAPRHPMLLYYHPLGLEPGTTYYWRVDEVELDGTTHEGDVWSFSVAPLTAYAPEPKDGAKWIEFDSVTLDWLPGQNAATHDIYFSADETAVAEGSADVLLASQPAHTFDVGALDPDTVYYWRVDEHITGGALEIGAVWSFRTLGEGGGIRGFYYGNMNLAGLPVLNRIDPQIDFDWADDVPAPGLPNDNFGVRWVGEIDVPFTETYTFYANTEDGVRLWVNDVQIMDLWQNRRSPTEAKASIDLEGGQRYPIVMEFYDAGGVAVAQLSWESPSTPKELIPQGAYSAPLRASSPTPAGGAVDVTQAPTLVWGAGEKAVQHQVYFGDDKDAVAAADTSTVGIYQGQQALDATSFSPGALEWDKTYYWRVDEVNNADAESPWTGSVWSFTTADFIVVDDFESYTNEVGQRVFQVWVDGLGYSEPAPGDPGNGTGAIVGHDIWSPDSPHFDGTIMERDDPHGDNQAMPLYYGNAATPYYSETRRTYTIAQDWTQNDVNTLELYFKGRPVGFMQPTADSMIMSASGRDIWDTSDEFRYAYKSLSGNGSITARVDSIVNTNGWAKGGVMIRETLDANARFAYVVVTPGQGVSFGRRPVTGGTCESSNEGGPQAPHWVKLTRQGNTLTAQHSVDGVTWVDVTDPDGDPTSVEVNMIGSVYIGLALTSHNVDAVTTAEFSAISTSGGVSGQWQMAEIGIDHPANDLADFYVALEDSFGRVAAVSYPDGSTVSEWTPWDIPLADFVGVNTAAVKKVYIGVGNRTAPTPDGAGMVLIDDIRVYKPEPVAEPNDVAGQ